MHAWQIYQFLIWKIHTEFQVRSLKYFFGRGGGRFVVTAGVMDWAKVWWGGGGGVPKVFCWFVGPNIGTYFPEKIPAADSTQVRGMYKFWKIWE